MLIYGQFGNPIYLNDDLIKLILPEFNEDKIYSDCTESALHVIKQTILLQVMKILKPDDVETINQTTSFLLRKFYEMDKKDLCEARSILIYFNYKEMSDNINQLFS